MSKRSVTSAWSGSLGLAFLIFLIWPLGVPAHAQPQPQRGLEGKNVLILHSHEANVSIFFANRQGY
jgi:hypothetical protein